MIEDGASVLDILEEERVASGDVVVVASRAQTLVTEAPAIVSVFTAEQLRFMGVQTLADLLDVVAPVRLWRGPNGDAVPVVRGMGIENGVAILFDGVPVLDTVTGQFAHYDMSVLGLKRIEVQRGPGSALYGGNAQTAVINLVSFGGGDETGTDLRASFGTAGDVRGHGRGHLGLGRVGTLSLFGAVQRTNGIEQRVGPDGIDGKSDLAEDEPAQSLTNPANPSYLDRRAEPALLAQAALGFETTFGLYLRSRFLYRSLSPLVNPSLGGGKGWSAITPESSYRREDVAVVSELGFKRELNTWLSLTASLRHVFNRRAQDGQLTGPLRLNKDRDFDLLADAWPRGMRERLSYSDQVFGADVQLDFRLPFYNHLVAGVNASWSWLSNLRYEANFQNATGRSTSAGVAPTPDAAYVDLTGAQYVLPGLQRRAVGVFLQDTFSPWKWLDLVAGVRLDVINDVGIVSDEQVRADELCAASPFGDCKPQGFKALRDEGKLYVQVSPRAGVVVKAPWLSLTGKVLFGQSFTPPPLGSLANQTAAETRGGARYSNPFLNSIIGRTLEAGGSIVPVQGLSVRASYFFISTQDEVIYAPDLEGFFNNAQRTVHGVEGEVLGEQKLHSALALTYRGSIAFSSTASQGRLIGFGADVYPSLIGNAWLGATLLDRVALAAGVQAYSASRREADDPRAAIPAGATVSVNLRVIDVFAKGFEIGVLAKNLADTRQQNAIPRFVGLPNDLPSGGRSIIGYASWNFFGR